MFDEAFPNGLFLLALAIVSIVFLGARKPGPVQPASPAEPLTEAQLVKALTELKGRAAAIADLRRQKVI
jgi:hypothetical protein